MNRRKTDKGGGDPGWYRSIPVNTTGWPTCSRCGVNVAVVDHRDGTCLRCKMAAKAEARKQETAR
jgi:hypothetical protein